MIVLLSVLVLRTMIGRLFYDFFIVSNIHTINSLIILFNVISNEPQNSHPITRAQQKGITSYTISMSCFNVAFIPYKVLSVFDVCKLT